MHHPLASNTRKKKLNEAYPIRFQKNEGVEKKEIKVKAGSVSLNGFEYLFRDS